MNRINNKIRIIHANHIVNYLYIWHLIYQYFKTLMKEDHSLDEYILDLLKPPQVNIQGLSASEEYFTGQLQQHFESQCESFLKDQRKLYQFSEKIQKNLKRLIKNLDSLEHPKKNQDQMQKLAKQLKKINDKQAINYHREQILSVLCKYIKMDSIRQVLVESNTKKILEAEEEYLINLEQLYNRLYREDSMVSNKHIVMKVPLIASIKLELQELFNESVNKVLTQHFTPTMLKLILSKYSKIFLKKQGQFYKYLCKNRQQHFKLGLYPLINNLNYVNNVSQLYELISKKLIEMLQQQIELMLSSQPLYKSQIDYEQDQDQGYQQIYEFFQFENPKNKDVVKYILQLILQQFLPILQRNIYKIKQLVEVSNVRGYLYRIYCFIEQQWPSQNIIQRNWQFLIELINKITNLLKDRLKDEGDVLKDTKYNIYQITSYIPIRQHFQTVKKCIKMQQKIQECQQNKIDEQNKKLNQETVKKQLIQNSNQKCKYFKPIKINWQSSISQLLNSRNPQQNSSNKSLLIFNLNVCYLYLRIINSQIREYANNTLTFCQQKFIKININEFTKQYYTLQSVQKILDICSDIPSIKKTLYAQLNLIGHDDLRNSIALIILQQFIHLYSTMLQSVSNKIPSGELTKQQVKTLCMDAKINIKKYGKLAQNLQVYSLQSIKQYISFQ